MKALLLNHNKHSPAILLGTPVRLLINAYIKSANHMAKLNGFNHADMVKTTRWSSNWASEWVRNVILTVEWLLVPDRFLWVF